MTWTVAVEPMLESVPVVCPTIVIWGKPARVHVREPETVPRTTTRRLPDRLATLGSEPPAATTTVSPVEAQRESWWAMQTPGPMAEHSLSAVHPRQVLVEVAQIGLVPEQVVLSVHCTHAPLLAQAGAVLVLAAHWLAVVQAVHRFAVQMGVAPEHPALVKHWTHLLVVVSQMGVAPRQLVLSVHCTQVPLLAQEGVALFLAAHWMAVVHAVQTFAAQMGVAAGQVALETHWTHLLILVSHTGVAPEQVVLSVHCTQVPLAEHAGVVGALAAHWMAVVHAVQTFAVQIGVLAGQVTLETHWTHLLVPVSHTGVAPEQVVLSVHCTHAPLAKQAGAVGLLATHWLAVVQAAQVFAVQIGVAPEQRALVRH